MVGAVRDFEDYSGYGDPPSTPPSGDNVLVRPYIPPDSPDYSLPEGGAFPEEPDFPEDTFPEQPDFERPYQDDPEQTGPVFVPDPTPMVLPGDSDREPPVSHVNPESDRRQMVWLIGSGLALVIAVAVTMFALWPGNEEETPTAAAPRPAPPAAGQPGSPEGSAPAGAPSAGPSKGSASPSATGAKGSAATKPPAAPGINTPNFPLPPAGNGNGNGNGPPTQTTPPATLAPPPAADRVGPVVAASGNCLDIDAGILLLGDELVARDCNNTSSQRFTLAKDGTLRVGGSCAVQEGGEVKVRVCNNAAAGQWRAGPGNTLVNNGSKQCLSSNDNDVAVVACGGSGQNWALP